MSATSTPGAPALLIALASSTAFLACRGEPAPEAAASAVVQADVESREIAPGIVKPDVRFEAAPEVGERFPDVEIHDAEGGPVRIRELASRKPHTVLTLGCLT